MRVTELPIPGAAMLEWEAQHDERGAFSRVLDTADLVAAGLDGRVAQVSISTNHLARTLRGLHWQSPSRGESKTVRCVRGRAYDVLVDVRPASAAYGSWTSVELAGGDGRALHVPPGVAHGFLTLEDATDLLYVMSVPFDHREEHGLRWDDATVAVAWPAAPAVLSDRDRSLSGWPPG